MIFNGPLDIDWTDQTFQNFAKKLFDTNTMMVTETDQT